MQTRRFLEGGVLVLLMAAAVTAQPPGRRGGGFGRRGFGGPGDMPNSAAALLRMPEVRQELATSDEQNKQIDETLAALGEQMRASFGSFQELQNLDEDERAKRFAEARQASEAANKKADEKLAGILDGKQLARLNGLRLQREGAAGLLRPEVAKQLALSEKQRDQIRGVQERSGGPGPGGAGRGGPGRGGPNPQQMSDDERREFFAQLQKQREAAESDMLAVLTADQRQKLADMKGAEFQFPEPRGGFGGPGPGGFGPGGGRGPGGGFGGPGGNAAERKRPPIKQREAPAP